MSNVLDLHFFVLKLLCKAASQKTKTLVNNSRLGCFSALVREVRVQRLTGMFFLVVFFAHVLRWLAREEGVFFFLGGSPAFSSGGMTNSTDWPGLACPDAVAAGPYKAPRRVPSSPVLSHAALCCTMQTPACTGRSAAACDSPPFILRGASHAEVSSSAQPGENWASLHKTPPSTPPTNPLPAACRCQHFFNTAAAALTCASV